MGFWSKHLWGYWNTLRWWQIEIFPKLICIEIFFFLEYFTELVEQEMDSGKIKKESSTFQNTRNGSESVKEYEND